MLRLRLQVIGCPRRALALTDTPRPNCLDCQGAGGIARDYGHPETGEYEGTDWEFCPCWTAWALPLIPLPRRLWRTPPGGYSNEPPF
ncbi:hypothetical protein [Streptomyces pseudovenezuelae]|uniref:Uncharacterized protein n=1 Tax=Streptomyces pseudovenezuelae TaxID=67350 RepID=A0ABT6LFC2_9ACTN|nr:hypothetical protein [Streptomyces pseudovenezuelae]MDH6214645.1 hypothetical protein [Streptomyces pseudovenezuelae]